MLEQIFSNQAALAGQVSPASRNLGEFAPYPMVQRLIAVFIYVGLSLII
jgi:hypothetical protein